MMYRKITVVKLYVQLYVYFVLSSFCVLNFVLPARSPNFAELTDITYKVIRLQI